MSKPEVARHHGLRTQITSGCRQLNHYRAVELQRVPILDGCTDEFYEFSDTRTRELVMCQALA